MISLTLKSVDFGILSLKRLLLKTDQATPRRLADASYEKLDNKTSMELSANSATFIHAYEDGALNTFRKSKDLEIQCSYELPIAHWATSRRLLSEEAERYPHWEPTLEATREPEEKLFKKRGRIEGLPTESLVRVNLYWIQFQMKSATMCLVKFLALGAPKNPKKLENSKQKQSKLLKILFVGSMSQRKGLADLFQAMKLLKKEPVQLSILGHQSMPMSFYREQCPNFKYFHTRTNQKVQQVMNEHDALVLPSIVEGRALVQQEALACGIPLIITPNAGGKDLIKEGLTGYVVPIRSPKMIAEKSCLFTIAIFQN